MNLHALKCRASNGKKKMSSKIQRMQGLVGGKRRRGYPCLYVVKKANFFLMTVAITLALAIVITSYDELKVKIKNPENNSVVQKESFIAVVITNHDAVCNYSFGNCWEIINVGGGCGGGAPREMAKTGKKIHLQKITGLEETTNTKTIREWYFLDAICSNKISTASVRSVFTVDLP